MKFSRLILCVSLLAITSTARAELSVKAFADLGMHAKVAEFGDDDEVHAQEAAEEDELQAARFGFVTMGLDLLLNADLHDRVKVVGEINFAVEADEFKLELERSNITYHVHDALQISLGLLRNRFGYFRYNYSERAFLFDTVTTPPYLQDDPAVTPESLLGLRLFGQVMFADDTWTLQYHLGMGNGRGLFGEDRQLNFDLNNYKAVAGGVAIVAPWLKNITLGLDVYHDKFEFMDETGREYAFTELMATSYLKVDSTYVSFVAEYMYGYYQDRHSGQEYNLSGWYARLTGTFDRWRPYIGVENIDYRDHPHPYLGLERDGEEIEREEVEASLAVYGGVSFQLLSFNILKLQVHQHLTDSRELRVHLQSAWVF